MTRSVDDPIPDIALPDGIDVRPVLERDLQRILAAQDEAFRDHWGHRDWTDADFQVLVSNPDFDPSLWRVAWEGDEIVSVIDTSIHPAENAAIGVNRAWLEHVSTRRAWRGRGIAKALIVSTLHELRQRGVEVAALGVDSSNPTGAFQLYEGLGFRVVGGLRVVARPFDEAVASGAAAAG
jgi:ribosomal protein S18 acetylase RimI-like enzyme